MIHVSDKHVFSSIYADKVTLNVIILETGLTACAFGEPFYST